MGIVYRYTDLSDETVKYIGIVWSGNRTLKQRVAEHAKNDDWCKGSVWRIEYLKKDIESRTDAEMLEAHYISKYGTDEFFNIKKKGWGKSDFVDDADDEWELYSTDEEQVSSLGCMVAVTDLCCDNWNSESDIGKRYQISLETDCGAFLFPSDNMIPLKICIGTSLSAYFEVPTYLFLGRYLKYLGIKKLKDFKEEGEVGVWRSEVTGEIEKMAISGDAAFAVFNVLPRKFSSSDDPYYEIDSMEICDWDFENSMADAEKFFTEYEVPLYDYIDWNVEDEEKEFARELTRKALRTGRIG